MGRGLAGETGRFPREATTAAKPPRSVRPREESNLRTQLRRLPLYPLSYGAVAEG